MYIYIYIYLFIYFVFDLRGRRLPSGGSLDLGGSTAGGDIPSSARPTVHWGRHLISGQSPAGTAHGAFPFGTDRLAQAGG